MPLSERTKPRVFIDADVLFAGAAFPSEHGASLLILRLAEITLVEAVTSQQVITETERNLREKLPETLPAFRYLVNRCLQVVPNQEKANLTPYQGLAGPKDLPILVDALRTGCPWLVTFNLRDYQPGHPDITILHPGDFISRVRELLARM